MPLRRWTRTSCAPPTGAPGFEPLLLMRGEAASVL